jgi:transposase InsO family protein
MESGQHSKSIFYQWLKGPTDRKKRQVTLIPEQVAINAIEVIINYPHFGGVKGQAYMIYHRQGYIPQHSYQSLKKTVSRIVFQEVSAQQLLPKPSVYEHERPQDINEIWAEDFTKVKVLGFSYPVAFVADVFSTKYLGYSAQNRENSELVEEPVVMAVAENNNAGPKEFMLSDNGSQYVSNAHGQLLARHEIVQKHIPGCKPQYNGSIECGMRDFKSVFYNVFSQNDLKEFTEIGINSTDKKKKLLETVALSVKQSIAILNNEIPRPSLAGVTPHDVYTGGAEQKRKLNNEYLMKQQIKEKVNRWSKSKYDLVKAVLSNKNLSTKELLIKHYFFQKKPLRRISKIPIEVWTN